MKSCEGSIGRVFVLRLEEGDVVPDCIEQFARDKRIACGQVILVGGVTDGQIVVGPKSSVEMPPVPMILPVDGAHELVGVGVLAPDEAGLPVLHIHASLGRAGQAVTGCLREGVKTWLVGEAILYEINAIAMARIKDKESGFVLLKPI